MACRCPGNAGIGECPEAERRSAWRGDLYWRRKPGHRSRHGRGHSVRRRRFLYNEIKGFPSFEEIWRRICVTHIKGEETSQYIIERSLMRPRALIELLRACRSRAVNLEHSRIEVSDIEEGERAYSNELLNNIAFEIRDIFPAGADILYEFLEAPVELSGQEIHSIVTRVVGHDKAEYLFELLLWYGFLGLVRDDQEITYFYQVNYSINLF